MRARVRVRVSARACVHAHVSTCVESRVLCFLFDTLSGGHDVALYPKEMCECSNVTRSVCVEEAGMCLGGIPYKDSTEKQGRHGDPPHAKERQWVNEPVYGLGFRNKVYVYAKACTWEYEPAMVKGCRG
jgi:hypothetical protein